MKSLLLALALLLPAPAVFGYDYEQALAAQSEELTTCAAYYALCYSALEMDREAAPENRLALDAGERAMEFSQMMSARTLAESRFERVLNEMVARLNGSFTGLAAMMDEHGEVCRQAVENPFQRLKYWLGKHSVSDAAVSQHRLQAE